MVTGSWDKTVRCWDPRGGTRVGTYPQPERVYSMSLVGHRLVVATAGRHITVYDLRHMQHPEQIRESSLKYQTRCVRCYPNGTGMLFFPCPNVSQDPWHHLCDLGFCCHGVVCVSQNFDVFCISFSSPEPVWDLGFERFLFP